MTTVDKGIVVYCASSERIDGKYFSAARRLGEAIARRGLPVVNGGGRGGLMAAVTDGALEAGGTSIGVLPRFMVDRGWNHPGLTRTIITESMHERKFTMARMSVGAIALPGGVGTLDELFEIITWRQLGLYTGGVVIYNVDGYFDDLLRFLQRIDDERFTRPGQKQLWHVATSPDEAVEAALLPDAIDIDEKY